MVITTSGILTALSANGVVEEKVKNFLNKPKAVNLSYLPNYNETKCINHIETIDFGNVSFINHTIVKIGDTLEDIVLKIKFPAINSGIYSKFAPFKLIQNIEFEIGGTRILWYDGNYLMTNYMVYNNESKYDAVDLDEEEREELKDGFESFISLGIKNLLKSYPLIATQFHSLRIIIKLNNLDKVIEDFSSSAGNVAVDLLVHYNFIDGPERNRLANTHHEYLISQIQSSGLEVSDQCTNFNYNYCINGIVSEAIIQLLDKNNNPVEKSNISELSIYLNNLCFCKYNTGYLNRKTFKEFIGIDNKYSNLFYIPFYNLEQKKLIGNLLNDTNTIPFGINFSKIDNVRISYKLKNPMNCKIVAFFKACNILRVKSGIVGTLFDNFNGNEWSSINSNSSIITPPINLPISTVSFTVGNLPDLPIDELLENKDIPIDSNCMISYKPIEQNNKIETCNRCHSIFLSDVYGQWLKHQHKCPYCVKDITKRTIFNANLIETIDN